ncbi:hypothetical protein KP509_03G014700 [Ceratopteris richardii]|uniref:UBX domain-containing protein n=1 Tax=Ceratopteris richardii TaxID=49495 RepID=A0A8T2V0C3_CERRI|nr:hypothetical protein KP509_03G014700 [Ceratopteris richardii]KAH7440872.1 hypothetical protein KP509_03G014700 [Ceratopteris richardii]
MAQGSRDNDDKIAHFQAVTGLEDTTLCERILKAYNWDLDVAVDSMAGGDVHDHGLIAPLAGSDQAESSSGPFSAITNHRDIFSDHAFLANANNGHAVMPYQRGTDLIWRVATLPFSIIRGSYNIMYGAFGVSMSIAGSILSDSIGAMGFRTHQYGAPTREGASSLSPTSIGAVEASDFIRNFEQEHGMFHPSFERRSFIDALRLAKVQFKFLLVYLHSPDHENTPSFVEQTLCSESVVQFLNEHFIIWGGTIRASEGYKMSISLKASTFPFCAVVMASGNHRVALLQQLEGHRSAADLVSVLQKVLDEQGSSLVAARIEEEARESNRRLRDEQDAAYRAALAADRERELQRRMEAEQLASEKAEAERRKRQEAIVAERAAQEAARKKMALEERKQQKASALGPEPEKGLDSIEVLIRFPNGERKGRRFLSSATISSIYDYVDSIPEFSADNYKLVANFPRVIYTSDKLGLTLKDAGLHPRASLYIQIED